VATVVSLGLFIGVMVRRERRGLRQNPARSRG